MIKLSVKSKQELSHAFLTMQTAGIRLFGCHDRTSLFLWLWIRRDDQTRKTEAYELMPGISHRTAVKRVQTAIDDGWILERRRKHDKRAIIIRLSKKAKEKINEFLIREYSALLTVGREG